MRYERLALGCCQVSKLRVRMVPLRLEMGTDGGDGEARRALSNKLPRVLRGGGSEGAQGRREQATASTVLTLSQGDCGQVQVKRSNICLDF